MIESHAINSKLGWKICVIGPFNCITKKKEQYKGKERKRLFWGVGGATHLQDACGASKGEKLDAYAMI